MRAESPKGRNREEGACNAPIPADVFAGFLYCHRPDNGSGLCNVHQSAKARGMRVRLANEAKRRAAGFPNRKRRR